MGCLGRLSWQPFSNITWEIADLTETKFGGCRLPEALKQNQIQTCVKKGMPGVPWAALACRYCHLGWLESGCTPLESWAPLWCPNIVHQGHIVCKTLLFWDLQHLLSSPVILQKRLAKNGYMAMLFSHLDLDFQLKLKPWFRILWIHRIRKMCWKFKMFSKDHSGFLQFHKGFQTTQS